MRFFHECHNVDEVKARWRELCKRYHPDLPGGDLETMKLINVEYEQALKLRYRTFKTEEETREAVADDLAVMAKAQEILLLPGLVIEIVGRWLWVTGNTYAHKDILKAGGFTWCQKKFAWSWHDKARDRKWRGSDLSLDEIKAKYGSRVVAGDEPRYLSA